MNTINLMGDEHEIVKEFDFTICIYQTNATLTEEDYKTVDIELGQKVFNYKILKSNSVIFTLTPDDEKYFITIFPQMFGFPTDEQIKQLTMENTNLNILNTFIEKCKGILESQTYKIVDDKQKELTSIYHYFESDDETFFDIGFCDYTELSALITLIKSSTKKNYIEQILFENKNNNDFSFEDYLNERLDSCLFNIYISKDVNETEYTLSSIGELKKLVEESHADVLLEKKNIKLLTPKKINPKFL